MLDSTVVEYFADILRHRNRQGHSEHAPDEVLTGVATVRFVPLACRAAKTIHGHSNAFINNLIVIAKDPIGLHKAFIEMEVYADTAVIELYTNMHIRGLLANDHAAIA